jgi:hypothetical protein
MFIAISLLTFGVFYTHFLDRLPIRIGLRSRKRFHAPFDRHTTWAKVIPGQGHVAAFWTGTLIAVHKDKDDENTMYLHFDDTEAGQSDATLTYLDLQPFFAASYLLERDSQIKGEEITMCYTFAKAGPEKTTILSDMRVSGLPIRLAMRRYFDDVLGDELDSFATMSDCHRAWTFRNAAPVNLTDEMGANPRPAPIIEKPDEPEDHSDELFAAPEEATLEKAAA